MGIRDNDSTSPDMMQARQRSGRNQNDLNLALGLAKRTSVTAGSAGGSVGAGSAAGGGIASVIGGGGGTGDGGGGYGGGGEGGYCFSGDTLVRLMDGSEKP